MQEYCSALACSYYAAHVCAVCLLSLCKNCKCEVSSHWVSTGERDDSQQQVSLSKEEKDFTKERFDGQSSAKIHNNSSTSSNSCVSESSGSFKNESSGDCGDVKSNLLPSVSFSILQDISHPQHKRSVDRLKMLLQSSSFIVLTVDEEDEQKQNSCNNYSFDNNKVRGSKKDQADIGKFDQGEEITCIEAARALQVFETTEKAITNFFRAPDDEKLAYQSVELIDGGNRKWKLGYHHIGPREYFVSFATQRAQQQRESWWPQDEFMNDFFAVANLYKDVCLNILTLILPSQASAVRKAQKDGTDCSIMEAFFYPNDRASSATSASTIAARPIEGQSATSSPLLKKTAHKTNSLFSLLPNCPPHIDPGFLSIEVASTTPGLECFDLRTDRWVPVDSICRGGRDVIVMVGGTLEDRSKGLYKATRHRVVSKPQPRTSYLYELLVS